MYLADNYLARGTKEKEVTWKHKKKRQRLHNIIAGIAASGHKQVSAQSAVGELYSSHYLQSSLNVSQVFGTQKEQHST